MFCAANRESQLQVAREEKEGKQRRETSVRRPKARKKCEAATFFAISGLRFCGSRLINSRGSHCRSRRETRKTVCCASMTIAIPLAIRFSSARLKLCIDFLSRRCCTLVTKSPQPLCHLSPSSRCNDNVMPSARSLP